MARYVILSFDNNAEADAFITAVESNRTSSASQVFFTVPDVSEVQEFRVVHLPATTFVRGLYMRPTQFCQCEGAYKGPFARGQKYGLWVHATCGKPTRAWAAGDHWYSSMGKNLLPPSPEAPEWRGEGIAHHRWDETSKQWLHVITGEPWNPKGSNQTQ